MILGAGIYQVPLIRTARRMGLYTIVVSIPGDYPGFALADRIYELNTRDKEAILAAAEKEQIDGICTSGTDVAVSTIGYVCEKMHLSGIPYEAAEILTDKAKMKDAFRQGGVSAADGMRVRSAEEAQKAAEQLGYPVVVKRVDSSGSRGITVVEHSGQIEEAYEKNTGVLIADYFKDLDYKAVPAVLCKNHGPFTWGKDAHEAVHNAVVLEEVAKMACRCELINPQVKPAPQELQDKHYYRKHGANAYYGQIKK